MSSPVPPLDVIPRVLLPISSKEPIPQLLKSLTNQIALLVVFQLCYAGMAEPADTVCIVIGIITITGPSFSFNTVLSGFPPLLQNFLDLNPVHCIWEVSKNEENCEIS